MNTPNTSPEWDDLERVRFSSKNPDRELTFLICGNMATNGRLFCTLAFVLALASWQHVGSTGRLFALAAALQVLALGAAVLGDGAQLVMSPRVRFFGLAAHWLAGAGLVLTILLALVLS